MWVQTENNGRVRNHGLNINYGMENIIGEYMENKSKCWRTLLYNILNGDYFLLLHGKFKDY
jgi:hypothetical protein